MKQENLRRIAEGLQKIQDAIKAELQHREGSGPVNPVAQTSSVGAGFSGPHGEPALNIHDEAPSSSTSWGASVPATEPSPPTTAWRVSATEPATEPAEEITEETIFDLTRQVAAKPNGVKALFDLCSKYQVGKIRDIPKEKFSSVYIDLKALMGA